MSDFHSLLEKVRGVYEKGFREGNPYPEVEVTQQELAVAQQCVGNGVCFKLPNGEIRIMGVRLKVKE